MPTLTVTEKQRWRERLAVRVDHAIENRLTGVPSLRDFGFAGNESGCWSPNSWPARNAKP